MCSFQCLYHQPVFQKTASLPEMARLLWYLTEDLNWLGFFDCNVGFTIKYAMVKVSEYVEEDEPLSQARMDMTNTKNKKFVECVTTSSRRLICLTNQLEILLRAASKVFSWFLSSFSIPLLLNEIRIPLLKITLKHQALSCFGRFLRLLQESSNLSALG